MGTTGHKYQGWIDAAEAAKLIRKDLKAAAQAGEIPGAEQGVTYRVTCKKYAGGQSVRVEVQGMEHHYQFERDHNGFEYERLTHEAYAVTQKVQRIATAYNRSNSDAMTDYFDETYYCSVQIRNPWSKAFDEKQKARKAAKAVAA